MPVKSKSCGQSWRRAKPRRARAKRRAKAKGLTRSWKSCGATLPPSLGQKLKSSCFLSVLPCYGKASGKAKQDAASIQKLQNELVAHKQQCDTEKKKITGDGAKVAAECQTKSKATEAELLGFGPGH